MISIEESEESSIVSCEFEGCFFVDVGFVEDAEVEEEEVVALRREVLACC
jgi:hypothetical protein